MESVIECRNLTHCYGRRKIYENLSFDVPEGRILGLLGKNGTGKTTTINILSGYLEPRSGECRIFGENIRRMRPLTRRRIGLLIEGHVQYQFMSIEQIERFYAAFYPKWRREAYYELMRKLHVGPGQRISRMSCGQRSQVALGLILAQDPDLLVLDDFSLGLDPGYRRLFADYLREYAKAEEDGLPHLAHHSGHGAPDRRLHHHGLRPHSAATPRRGDSRPRAALYVPCARGGSAARRRGVLPPLGGAFDARILLVPAVRGGGAQARGGGDSRRRAARGARLAGGRFHRSDRKILKNAMLKAILYKEWIKSRWYLAVAFAVTCAFAGYAMLRLYRALGMMGAGHIWEVMVTRNAVFVEQMEYVPLLAGLLLAVVQFAPEMHRKCLKLTLHLPVSALRATGTMLLFGVAALTVVSGTSLALVAGAASPVLPHELVANIVGTLMPWYAAGLAAYLFAAWVILEPTWKRRTVNILMAVLLLRIFFLAPVPRAYAGFLPVLLALTLLSASLAWLSVVRFMAGRQD